MRRLGVYTLGFLRNRRIRRILALAGWQVVPGWRPARLDAVGVWGRKPVSWRGLAAARRFAKPVLNVEDAFLRSVRPGYTGAAPTGLILDEAGLYFDASAPSRLEEMLREGDFSAEELARAEAGIEFLKARRLSKYNAWGAADLPEPGFVLVVDQTRGDASIRLGGVREGGFAEMLAAAKAAHPEARIVIRTHPEVADAQKQGHFSVADCDERTQLYRAPANPWDLLERAKAVYVMTSQMGFEAILAGHRPHVFGQPFYAGWGLTEDAAPRLARRGTTRSRAELFAAVMLRYPTWYDPCRDRLCTFEDAALQLAEEARAWAENGRGAVCFGFRPWKHAPMRAFLAGARGAPLFENDPARAAKLAAREGRELVCWAGKESAELRAACADAGVPLRRMEDGFLRSVGLGAQLLPAASLVLDDAGIYFDPTRPSRMERLIAAACTLSGAERARAEALRARINGAAVTKYNVGGAVPDLGVAEGQRVVLVPGQVEDDASIRLGTRDVSTNLELLRRARAAFPDDFIIYKPHPDVEMGLRDGEIAADGLADFVAREMSAAALMTRADIVFTMTSLMGFEALMRGREVHCLGMPFYAGWGLTEDHGQICARRQARPDLAALVHAALIAYPRYFDPVSGRATTAEVILERLAGRAPALARNPLRRMRWLAAVQYRLRRFAWIWRR